VVDTAHGMGIFMQIGWFPLPAVTRFFTIAAIMIALITHELNSLRVIEFLSSSA